MCVEQSNPGATAGIHRKAFWEYSGTVLTEHREEGRERERERERERDRGGERKRERERERERERSEKAQSSCVQPRGGSTGRGRQ
ncbi:hypothetical protein ANANG_G00132360 [Anguilla anguilla]|uniref:Uncharacterized protein n=1 Tax=Anguilla anguilla TaxID=7936 RepID=A0A9D3MFF9_ANGAN|nr:hypothetical protein ANANG_G00132360 [Anguilla anguilla]